MDAITPRRASSSHDRVALLICRLAEITREARSIKEELAASFDERQRRMERLRAAHERYQSRV
jgi:hypothetical protein